MVGNVMISRYLPPDSSFLSFSRDCAGSRFARRSRSAFTLIELLVVIVIIGILAAIILPVTARVRQSARRVQCVSNLRQIGIACANYITENKGACPGPCWTSMTCMNNGNHLGQYIWDYLANPKIDSQKRSSSLACPAWFKATGQSSTVRFFDLKGSYEIGGETKYTFGIKSTSSAKGPGLYHEIPTPARLRAIWDIDQELHNPSGDYAGIPVKPVHGSYRNVLFFDWHVVSMKLGSGTSEEWKALWDNW
ncbi:prepilin-type N-terminal cleavage/methylation domain-containing protein [Opitutaceae bacterium TAV1]|nr:prepilin-type N-terminal cleavage/methylation domain-containing protein [Opitutaceae bacterium TAV1]